MKGICGPCTRVLLKAIYGSTCLGICVQLRFQKSIWESDKKHDRLLSISGVVKSPFFVRVFDFLVKFLLVVKLESWRVK